MLHLNWADCYYHKVTPHPLQIGDMPIDVSEHLDFDAIGCSIPAQSLEKTVLNFTLLAEDNSPQLAFYVFSDARHPMALNSYFPLTNSLDEAGKKTFYQLAQKIILHPNFDVRLLNEQSENIVLQVPQIAFFVAAHIAEVFFYRRDLLDSLLDATCRIWLYTTPQAFQKDGGVSGGNFNGSKGCVQLVLSRLFEGFNAPTPGVAPFLHEFGHLLDFLDVGQKVITKSSSFLPGMRPGDEAVYKPEAREHFLKGKRLEMERYERLCDGAPPTDPLPLGHPYVFQNNTEFIAGYFEMFFRNPHAFAAQNPDLFQAFSLTFGQDPRQCWKQDFPFYLEQNRSFYYSGQRPAKHGLTLPE